MPVFDLGGRETVKGNGDEKVMAEMKVMMVTRLIGKAGNAIN